MFLLTIPNPEHLVRTIFFDEIYHEDDSFFYLSESNYSCGFVSKTEPWHSMLSVLKVPDKTEKTIGLLVKSELERKTKNNTIIRRNGVLWCCISISRGEIVQIIKDEYKIRDVREHL